MTQLPHVLKRIRLNLARSKEFPLGSDKHGYEFVAPLDRNGHIDPELWHKYREHCGVRRFWEGEDDEIGHLVHKPGGAEHGRWVFDYDGTAEADDEAGYRSAIMRFARANMFRSAARTETCTRSRWSRSSRRRNWPVLRGGSQCTATTAAGPPARF